MFRFRVKNAPAVIFSVAMHVVIFASLALVHFHTQASDLKVAIESIFEADRPVQEFTNELNADTQVAESMNVLSGGSSAVQTLAMGSGSGGGGGGGGGGLGVASAKIEGSSQFKDPTVTLGGGDIGLPGLESLGNDLGGGMIAGEPTAASEGYGPALDRITQELLRIMREERVLVAWLFDESESMKDDQQEIREHFHKIYEELGLAQERETSSKKKNEGDTLLTAIHSFGEKVTAITPKPTTSIPEVRAAIEKIGVDESGKENTMMAINKVLDQYRQTAQRTRRKLVIVVVTDESGDDGAGIDEVIIKCKRFNTPVYILGREAVFGYPYATLIWKDPKYGLDHWLNINRGPETAFPEALQYDGLHGRDDRQRSGFGPYELSRLAKETGGIYFVLPSEEENLVSRDAIERRKFSFIELKEYIPELIPRRDYEEHRNKSKFRSTIWDVIKLLNPHLDGELNVKEWGYPTDPARFKTEGDQNFKRALRAMGLLNQAAQTLEKIKPLREKEDSQRWRANFDLVYAQVLAYRVRLFQFLLAMDGYLNNFPKPKNLQNNIWAIQRVPELAAPTERQIKLTKVDMDEIKKQMDTARTQFDLVRKSHPGTPWAVRAEYELARGFGMRFVETFRDPRYDNLTDIKVPKF